MKGILAIVSAAALTFALAFLWLDRAPGGGDREWRRFLEGEQAERFADMGEYRMRYVEYGSGEPLLLIHGFADTSYSWHRNIRPLAEAGYRVLAVDFPGMGGSGAPAGFSYRLEDLARELLKFMDAAGAAKFHVAGNSMGGGIALCLSLRHPDRVRSAVLVDPACTVKAGLRITMAVRWEGLRHGILKAAGPWTVRLALYDIHARPWRVTETMVGEYAKPFQRPDFRDNLSRLLGGYFSPQLEDLAKDYPSLKVPCLVIWGSEDRWIGTSAGARTLHQRLPGAKLAVIGDAGHVPHLERADYFNKLAVGFLKEGGVVK